MAYRQNKSRQGRDYTKAVPEYLVFIPPVLRKWYDFLKKMSDVDAGGATVFPQIGVTLHPRKRSAAFWYNLHRNGEGDMLTRHAACPVLAGSKWVSNKWLHERGQEFLRPCGLHETD